MASRPRGWRAATGRDGGKDVDLEAEYLARIIQGVKEAKEQNDHYNTLNEEAMKLEADLKAQGNELSLEKLQHLQQLYRDQTKAANLEKQLYTDNGMIDHTGALMALRGSDEPASRNGAHSKSRKMQRPAEPDAAESPGPSPSDSRLDYIKRRVGGTQRSSSVASARSGATTKPEDGPETNKGLLAERSGRLVENTEVFYRYPEDTDLEGTGCLAYIKRILQEKKPIQYEVQDPEPDANTGKHKIHKATARDLTPIPPVGAQLPTILNGADVAARYPDTDTFYPATVQAFQKGRYKLKFEDDNEDQEVDKRFVFKSRSD